MSTIQDYWLSRRKVIDRLVEEFLNRNREWEHVDLTRYILKDGKRLRGVLMMLFSEALGATEEQSSKGALAVEVLHAASLALDDIVDGDLERRGDKSAWVVFGNRRVILLSNYLVPLALRYIESYGPDALSTSLKLWLDTAEGALKDLYGRAEDYFKVIELKTASLFKLSMVLAAYSSRREELVDEMMTTGSQLGSIYQLVDDYVDFVRYRRGQIKELEGSALYLYQYTDGNPEEIVNQTVAKLKESYEQEINRIHFPARYHQLIRGLPDLLMAAMLSEI
ncbi:geranylgeranyl pyrophosphate synthase [Sulfodiicoccus acidiphilus]|uniref:Geranylgeranyl pyrophosphate synthase n=1 Tax=Sulfodiicoccus acidiphilus TaxID=1670455 RepID=A0A348B401_9CREN|nr:hexaprenyl pyrophosphate synthase [Sulfodiicoccus acidiphilus]BBD72903.1 geranylgeranyl pyrophosphate synthase [Sulfodiicoccus acidiphilus]GGT88128.1 geranylgeranyl pyrophosphate synthase [Sulfodiicoccus acidiphilus]